MNKRIVLTPEQEKEGWLEFRPDRIPNMVKVAYRNLVRRPDGNYEADAPSEPSTPRTENK